MLSLRARRGAVRAAVAGCRARWGGSSALPRASPRCLSCQGRRVVFPRAVCPAVPPAASGASAAHGSWRGPHQWGPRGSTGIRRPQVSLFSHLCSVEGDLKEQKEFVSLQGVHIFGNSMLPKEGRKLAAGVSLCFKCPRGARHCAAPRLLSPHGCGRASTAWGLHARRAAAGGWPRAWTPRNAQVCSVLALTGHHGVTEGSALLPTQ